MKKMSGIVADRSRHTLRCDRLLRPLSVLRVLRSQKAAGRSTIGKILNDRCGIHFSLFLNATLQLESEAIDEDQIRLEKHLKELNNGKSI
jgi:hypothetical protein